MYFKGAPSAPEDGFGEIATNDFRKALDKAPELIKESWEVMMDMQSRPDTWEELSEIFATCDEISDPSQIDNLYAHLSAGYMYMAMTDYPYPASFLEPMPGYPVNESVKPFESISTLGNMGKLSSAANFIQKKVSKINGGMTSRES